MSRARSIKFGDEEIWFDVNRNGEKAKATHLEILALVEDVDLDDLLDEHITQGTVLKRLREALDQGTIPSDVLERREKWRAERQQEKPCRICGKKEDSTKHHYVNRWILKELVDYAWKWASRIKNCIPLCVDCHRDLHERSGECKSIVSYLNDEEKAFAEMALEALHQERPFLLVLLARGDDSVYESRLVKDWLDHKFSPTDPEPISPAKLLEQAV